jgi:hypothetical protein
MKLRILTEEKVGILDVIRDELTQQWPFLDITEPAETYGLSRLYIRIRKHEADGSNTLKERFVENFVKVEATGIDPPDRGGPRIYVTEVLQRTEGFGVRKIFQLQDPDLINNIIKAIKEHAQRCISKSRGRKRLPTHQVEELTKIVKS